MLSYVFSLRLLVCSVLSCPWKQLGSIIRILYGTCYRQSSETLCFSPTTAFIIISITRLYWDKKLPTYSLTWNHYFIFSNTWWLNLQELRHHTSVTVSLTSDLSNHEVYLCWYQNQTSSFPDLLQNFQKGSTEHHKPSSLPRLLHLVCS